MRFAVFSGPTRFNSCISILAHEEDEREKERYRSASARIKENDISVAEVSIRAVEDTVNGGSMLAATFVHPRIKGPAGKLNDHGTGCSLASAIAAGLAKGLRPHPAAFGVRRTFSGSIGVVIVESGRFWPSAAAS